MAVLFRSSQASPLKLRPAATGLQSKSNIAILWPKMALHLEVAQALAWRTKKARGGGGGEGAPKIEDHLT